MVAFPTLCRSSNLHHGPFLLALPEELNWPDGCVASPEALRQVRKHALLQVHVALQVSRRLRLHHLGCFRSSSVNYGRSLGKPLSVTWAGCWGDGTHYSEGDTIRWHPRGCKCVEKKFKIYFVVAKFRLLPRGTSLQGFLLWEIKWQARMEGNLLLLSWKPPWMCCGERQGDRAGLTLEQFFPKSGV